MTNHRILVIDDDPVLRNTLSDILKASGYETLAAGDGFEGLALLAEIPAISSCSICGCQTSPGSMSLSGSGRNTPRSKPSS